MPSMIIIVKCFNWNNNIYLAFWSFCSKSRRLLTNMTLKTVNETSFAFLISAEKAENIAFLHELFWVRNNYCYARILHFTCYSLCIIIDMNNWNYMPGILFCLGIKWYVQHLFCSYLYDKCLLLVLTPNTVCYICTYIGNIRS